MIWAELFAAIVASLCRDFRRSEKAETSRSYYEVDRVELIVNIKRSTTEIVRELTGTFRYGESSTLADR